MLRVEIEDYMKKNNLRTIDIVYNESDKLGVYTYLSSDGFLKDYTNHRVDRKRNIWGYLEWVNGKAIKKAWNK